MHTWFLFGTDSALLCMPCCCTLQLVWLLASVDRNVAPILAQTLRLCRQDTHYMIAVLRQLFLGYLLCPVSKAAVFEPETGVRVAGEDS